MIKNTPNFVQSIQDDGKEYTAFLFALKSKQPGFTNGILNDRNCLLLGENSIQDYSIEKLVERDKKLYALGPFLELRPLFSENDCLSYAEFYSFVKSLVNAENMGQSMDISDFRNIYITGNSRFLFLSKTLKNKMSSLYTAEDNERCYTPFQNSLLTDTRKQKVYSLACYLYTVLTGSLPSFYEKRSYDMLIEPKNLNPAVSDKLNEHVLRSLEGSTEDLNDFFYQLPPPDTEVFVTRPENEAKALIQQGSRILKNAQKKSQIQTFLRNYKSRIILTLTMLFFVAYIAVQWIENVSQDISTVGLEAIEVLHLFFESQNNLDIQSLRATADRSYKTELVRAVEQLHIVSKARMAYESHSGFISASEWAALDRPEIPPHTTLFGVILYSIEALPTEGYYQAEYEQWMPAFDDTEDSMYFQGNYYIEEFFLSKDKQAYEIKSSRVLKQEQQEAVQRAALPYPAD